MSVCFPSPEGQACFRLTYLSYHFRDSIKKRVSLSALEQIYIHFQNTQCLYVN